MSAMFRSIDIRFWSDNFVRQLTKEEKFAFVYFLTSPHSTWCGIYELPLDVAAFEMGIPEKELRSLMPKLEPKVIFIDGWIVVPKWVKYHSSESGNMSPQQKKGLFEAYKQVPERIWLKIKELGIVDIPYVYPMDRVLASASSFASTSMPVASLPGSYEKVPIAGDGLTEVAAPQKSKKESKGVEELIRWSEQERGFKFKSLPKQKKALRLIADMRIPLGDVKARWHKLSQETYFQEHGFDWMNVFSSFDKKR